tara:strand:- start:727 stop:1047 length:321 start_codon:yes stop_codon:yes gene_type:complete
VSGPRVLALGHFFVLYFYLFFQILFLAVIGLCVLLTSDVDKAPTDRSAIRQIVEVVLHKFFRWSFRADNEAPARSQCAKLALVKFQQVSLKPVVIDRWIAGRLSFG